MPDAFFQQASCTTTAAAVVFAVSQKAARRRDAWLTVPCSRAHRRKVLRKNGIGARGGVAVGGQDLLGGQYQAIVVGGDGGVGPSLDETLREALT